MGLEFEKIFDLTAEEPEEKNPVPELKHSLFVSRNTKDQFFVSIRGTDNKSDVMKLIRAAEKEISIRKRRAIPLSKSA